MEASQAQHLIIDIYIYIQSPHVGIPSTRPNRYVWTCSQVNVWILSYIMKVSSVLKTKKWMEIWRFTPSKHSSLPVFPIPFGPNIFCPCRTSSQFVGPRFRHPGLRGSLGVANAWVYIETPLLGIFTTKQRVNIYMYISSIYHISLQCPIGRFSSFLDCIWTTEVWNLNNVYIPKQWRNACIPHNQDDVESLKGYIYQHIYAFTNCPTEHQHVFTQGLYKGQILCFWRTTYIYLLYI